MALILPLRVVAVALRPLTVRLRRQWRLFAARRRQHRTMARLQMLSDRSLKDIGLSRSEIDCVAYHGRYARPRHRVSPLGR